MAARFQDTFYQYDGTTGQAFTVTIYDSDYSGSTSTFNARQLSIFWDGGQRNRNTPVITTQCELTFVEEDSGTVNLISDIIGADEERFVLEIKKGSDLYWVGFILVDQITQLDEPLDRDITLRATDGIGRLQKEDYNNAGTAYTGKETFLDHLYNILGKIGLDSYWGASDEYFTAVTNWWENGQTYTSTKEPLDYSRFDHKAFISVDKDGFQSFKSAYDVLVEICKDWGARFIFSEGVYRFVQFNEYGNANDVYIRKFDKSKNQTVETTTGFSSWEVNEGTDVITFSGGKFSSLPALKEVVVDYNHFSTRNLLEGVTYTDVSNNQTVEDVDSNGNTARLFFTATAQVSIDYIGPIPQDVIPAFLYCKFIINNNGKYLRRGASRQAGSYTVTYSAQTWIQAAVDFDYVIEVPLTDTVYNIPISFLTNQMQEDDQDLDFDFYLDHIEDIGTNDQTANYTVSLQLTNVYLEAIINGTLSDQYNVTRFISENNNTGNSDTIEVETLLGDGPTGNAFGHIQTTTDKVTWEVSDNWRSGNSGSYVAFSQLLANEIHSGQASPVQTWTGTFDGVDYEAHYSFIRNTNIYVFAGGRFDVIRRIWSGTWWKVGIEPTEINVADSVTFVGTPGFVSPSDDPPPPPTPPGTTVVGVVADSVSIGTTLGSVDDDDPLSDVDVNPGNEDDIFFEDDTLIIVSPTTGENQIVNVGSNVDHSTGDTNLTIVPTTALSDLPTGSLILPNPAEQQANIQWGRRKFLNFHLVDVTTDLPTSTSYTSYGVFFRPYSAPATATGYQFEGKKYIRRIYWGCADNPSASPLVSYTLELVRGSTPTTVASTTMNGQATEATTTPNSGEALLQDDYYWFRVKQNSASGLSMNQGLHVVLEIINKAFAPTDIAGLELWLKADAEVFNDAGSTNCTDGQTVQEWHDQSGNSRDVSQTTAGNKPIWNTDGQNNYPYITFDGTDDYLVQSSVLGLTDYPFSIVVVFKQSSAATSEQSVVAINDNSGTGTDYHTIFSDANAPALEAASKDGTEYSSSNYYGPGQFIIATGVWSGDTSRKIYLNETVATESTDSVNWDAAVLDEFLVGRLMNSGSRRDFAGDIYEILVYSTALSDDDRGRLYRYLKRKYAAPNFVFSPDHLPGLQLWLKADANVYSDAGTTLAANGDTVQQWNDQSGNNNASQSSSGARPTYNTGGPNTRPYLSFDGTDYLDIGAVSDFVFLHETGGTVFVVVQPGTSSNPNTAYGIIGTGSGSTSNIGFTLAYDDRASLTRNNVLLNNVYTGGGASTNAVMITTADDVITPNTYSYISLVLDPDNGTAADRSKIYINSGSAIGGNTDSTAPSSSNSTYALQIGAIGNATAPLTGNIAEVIIYDSVLSDSDRALVETYLSGKYNII